MLVVDNKIIKTPIEDIIKYLKQQLILNRIDLLDTIDIQSGKNNIRVTCPFHSNGHEKTPSCDILIEDKGDIPAGTVHCFGCGFTGNFVKFVAKCLNTNYRSAAEWILSVSTYDYLETSRDLNDLFIDKNIPHTDFGPGVSILTLKQYDFIHPYMFQRKLTDDIIKKFEVGFDPKTNSLTFPVYVDGICRFVCKRDVSKHKFIMPKMEEKPIYGLDYLTGKDVIVCESIINALTCYVYGKEAIALLGTGSSKQYEVLNKLGIRNYILAFDGDEAGKKGSIRFKKNVTSAFITEMQLPSGKDINDLSKEEFELLYENAI